MGDVASLGIALGTMGGIIDMTRNAMSPLVAPANDMSQVAGRVISYSWDCPICGQRGVTSNFCPNCGTPKPISSTIGIWDCPKCGKSSLTSSFCPDCGTKKPVLTWDCECGEKTISSKYCPNCGREKEGIIQ